MNHAVCSQSLQPASSSLPFVMPVVRLVKNEDSGQDPVQLILLEFQGKIETNASGLADIELGQFFLGLVWRATQLSLTSHS